MRAEVVDKAARLSASEAENAEVGERRRRGSSLNEGLDVALYLVRDVQSQLPPADPTRQIEVLTTCANTRWRKTCMTVAGCGKTAVTICASCPTVMRISS